MANEKIPYKIYVEESEMPKSGYNLRADMKNKPAPLLDPASSSALMPLIFSKCVIQIPPFVIFPPTRQDPPLSQALQPHAYHSDPSAFETASKNPGTRHSKARRPPPHG